MFNDLIDNTLTHARPAHALHRLHDGPKEYAPVGLRRAGLLPIAKPAHFNKDEDGWGCGYRRTKVMRESDRLLLPFDCRRWRCPEHGHKVAWRWKTRAMGLKWKVMFTITNLPEDAAEYRRAWRRWRDLFHSWGVEWYMRITEFTKAGNRHWHGLIGGRSLNVPVGYYCWACHTAMAKPLMKYGLTLKEARKHVSMRPLVAPCKKHRSKPQRHGDVLLPFSTAQNTGFVRFCDVYSTEQGLAYVMKYLTKARNESRFAYRERRIVGAIPPWYWVREQRYGKLDKSQTWQLLVEVGELKHGDNEIRRSKRSRLRHIRPDEGRNSSAESKSKADKRWAAVWTSLQSGGNT